MEYDGATNSMPQCMEQGNEISEFPDLFPSFPSVSSKNLSEAAVSQAVESIGIGLDADLVKEHFYSAKKDNESPVAAEMAPISPLKKNDAVSESSLHKSSDTLDEVGICNEGFEEGSAVQDAPHSDEESDERIPGSSPGTDFDIDSKEIVLQTHSPTATKGSFNSSYPNNYGQDSSLTCVPSSGTNTVGHSRGASTDGSTIEAYTPSINDSRRGTYSDSGTLPIGILYEGPTIIEENGHLQERNGDQKKAAMEKECLNKDSGHWNLMKMSMNSFGRPLMRKHNTLPPDPSKVDQFKYAFTCPPHGQIGSVMTWTLFLLLFWGSLVFITADKEALPGGTLFSLFVLIVFAQIGGIIVEKVHLPPLLGMLLVGILFRSVPGIDIIGASIKPIWSATLRSTALVVILIRAGLGLDPKALRKLSLVVVRLACLPCLTEAVTVAIVSHLLLGFPWVWGFMLGFILAAVSPAVVVPCLLSLQEQGWGVEKGIPTLVIAAASIDDVIAISGFGVSLGMTFATGSAAWQGLKGPIELLMGISYGVIVGVILWMFPHRRGSNVNVWRFLMLFLAGLLAIFGSKGIQFDGAGALACLCVAFVAGVGYRSKASDEEGAQVKDYFNYMWMFFQPLLFGLIGTEIKVTELDAETIGFGIVTLLIGLTLRVFVSFFAVMGGGLTIRERLFVALAWLPKATVQAAIGSTALDFARNSIDNPNFESEVEMGKKVLTIAVLVILLTAPIGAIAIVATAPKLLKKAPSKNDPVDSPS